ncbi:MAG: transcriptional regulator [Meiothermus sp.]|nr:transcriptional regulator [Meiothermus sp.]
MRWNTVLLSLIAALALPVVGLVTGRVVGDFFLRGDLIGAVGAGFGVLVYALALASSYSHLRHYYQGYEAQGVRASWALALAVEVATFYMSFAYVVIHSPWAFWGSLIGAFVVFWGNFSSMYEARTGRLSGETAAQPARAEAALHGVFPEQTLQAFVSAEAVETRISQVRQEVRAVSKQSPGGPVHPTGDEPLPRRTVYEEHPEVRPVTLPTHEEHEATSGQDFPLSEADQEVLRLAAAGPVGPSSVSRALGIAKSSASDRLRRLERLGLLVKQGSSYIVAAEG